MAQRLNAQDVVDSLAQLSARIGERFPNAGLARVCAELVETARRTAKRARAAGQPNILLRAFAILVLVAAVAAQVYAARLVDWTSIRIESDAVGFTQALESAVNLVILAGVAIWFLFTLEERLKRRRVLVHLHELRSFAHVIDMHQLTKDPTVLLKSGERTQSSPKREMTEFELGRYLDYCSEMLSLTGKLAALYGERTRDTEIVAAVNDIETLTTNLSRKIWQKIMLIGGDRSPQTPD